MKRLRNLKNQLAASDKKGPAPTRDQLFSSEYLDSIKHLDKQDQKICLKAREAILETFRIRDTYPFKFSAKKDDVYMYLHPHPKTKTNVIYMKTTIPWSAKRLSGFFRDPGVTFQKNIHTREYEKVQEINENTSVWRYQMAGKMFVADRDVGALFQYTELLDGSFIHVSASIDHKKIPLRPKVVRASADAVGYIITPISENEWMWEYIQQGDLKGYVPTKIINWMTFMQHDAVVDLKKWLMTQI